MERTELTIVMEIKLVGRTIIACGDNWIQLDNGQKIYLEESEVETIVS